MELGNVRLMSVLLEERYGKCRGREKEPIYIPAQEN
jgi:hypothetical protein